MLLFCDWSLDQKFFESLARVGDGECGFKQRLFSVHQDTSDADKLMEQVAIRNAVTGNTNITWLRVLTCPDELDCNCSANHGVYSLIIIKYGLICRF